MVPNPVNHVTMLSVSRATPIAWTLAESLGGSLRIAKVGDVKMVSVWQILLKYAAMDSVVKTKPNATALEIAANATVAAAMIHAC